jgi:hypothetical protein
VQVVGEDEDSGAGVPAADVDLVRAAVVPQGDGAAGVDLVVPDPVVADVERGVGRDGWSSAGRDRVRTEPPTRIHVA